VAFDLSSDRRSNGAVTLYHFLPSLCSQKVRVALAEKGVAYESRVVDIGPAMENYAGWYAELNPRMVVPTLVHEGAVVVDSAKIVRYVDAAFDGPALSPPEPAPRAVMDTWIARQDGFPFRELSYASFPGLLGWAVLKSFGKRRATLRRRMAERPDLAERYEARLRDVDAWERAVRAPRAGEVLVGEARALLDDLAEQVAQRPFLAGRRYSLADAVWTVVLARTVQLRLDEHWSDSVRAYYARMRSRPSFTAADVWEDQRPAQLVPTMARSFVRRAFG
jgi:glutathione S-transferase